MLSLFVVWVASRSRYLCNVSQFLLLLAGLGVLASHQTLAEPYELSDQLSGPLGAHASYLLESDTRLNLRGAVTAMKGGEFRPDYRPVPSFGIGAQPVWVHLPLHNPSENSLSLQLAVGKPWIDQMEVYILHGGHLGQSWRSGDIGQGGPAFVPGVGFIFPVILPPGGSEIYIRAQTAEPLVLEVLLLSDRGVADKEHSAQYQHGVLYGFLMAFIFYNTMLYIGLRERSNLFYALYLFSFMALSFNYTGLGRALMWPESLALQRYGISVIMVLFGSAGFLFASHFLRLKLHAPKVRTWVGRISLLAITLVMLSVAFGSQKGAVVLAFHFMAVFTVSMVLLGLLTISHGELVGRYFLCAALCGMIGIFTSLSALWGLLPMNSLTYHSMEVGLALEATLFSLALASRVRQQERARKTAEQLARIDALTGLPNRRAFFDDSEGIWRTAVRHNRPLSVIMLDIDHFKKVNDRYGHPVGDRILIQVAKLLAERCRVGDLLSRWGGEEFVLLLPETNLQQACQFSERIRRAVEYSNIAVESERINLSVSVGAAQYENQLSLEELICKADRCLYHAKENGRNQVSPPYSCEKIA